MSARVELASPEISRSSTPSERKGRARGRDVVLHVRRLARLFVGTDGKPLVLRRDELRAEARDQIEHDGCHERSQRPARRQEGRHDAEQAHAEQHTRGGNPNRDIGIRCAEN